MRNGGDVKITTPAELYLLVTKDTVENVLQTGDIIKQSADNICSVCGKPTEKQYKAFSENYAEYSVLRHAYSGIVCDNCYIITKRGGDKTGLRIKHGIYLHYRNEEDKHMLLIERSNYQQILHLMLNPPLGHFLFAFNRSFFYGKGSHFLIFGKVNYYNKPGIRYYYITSYNNTILMDVDFLARYMEAVDTIGCGICIENLHIKDLIQKYQDIGIEKTKLIENIRAIQIVNKLGKVNTFYKRIKQ